MANVTSTFHHAPYAAINIAKHPQTGRTVLITGSTSGIGFATARAFVRAGAATVIVSGRQEATVVPAVQSLESEAQTPLQPVSGTPTKVLGKIVDVSSRSSISNLWDDLKQSGVAVDILVLNATVNERSGVLLKGAEETWKHFETNVLGNLLMIEQFLAQGPVKEKILLNVSSGQAHSNPSTKAGAYSASKAAMASLLQHLADERPQDEVQILNVHPGSVFTEKGKQMGVTESTLPWDDVWASSPSAAFLHGRFVWVNWDVEELMMAGPIREKIQTDAGFLKIGLQGIESQSAADLMRKEYGLS